VNIGIIGAGLQGKRRANALKQFNNDKLVVIADTDIKMAKTLAAEMHCQATDSWEEVTTRKDIDAVIICTPTYLHLPMGLSAVRNGKHVLCDKPLGRNPSESEGIVNAAKDGNVILGVGLNHRFHPAISRAHELVEKGFTGELDFIRCRYGHCGRPGYEKEWRGSADKAGGGQLLDQGVHVLDLIRWFMGDFKEVTGFITTRHWAISPLEDNAFALLRTGQGKVASLHVSWTQWKNLFSFEVFGKDGYVIVDGLGGSYGTEKLILGKRLLSSEPFKQEMIEFTSGDNSWYYEWENFVMSISNKKQPLACGNDGLQAINLAYAIYESSNSGRTVQL
jgi:predicted dehydrogenase